VLGDFRMLHRDEMSLDEGKSAREIEGSIRIRACVLLKSCSLPSGLNNKKGDIPCRDESINTGLRSSL
jgi:hypothetical protein